MSPAVASPSEPRGRLESMLDEFPAELAGEARRVLERMRELLPGAVELVYDNANALVVGFGPSEKASETPISIAVYPRWINLFFLHGAALSDPEGMLEGDAKQVRRIRLASADGLDDPRIRMLMDQALSMVPSWPDASAGRAVIRSTGSPRHRGLTG